MNGAVQAGKRAALEVIYRFHPQAIDYEHLHSLHLLTKKHFNARIFKFLIIS
jgi:hypothetical protein